MVPRDRFINKLRELGYTHKGQTKKIALWRRKGDGHSVSIRRKEDPLSAEYVRSVLKQAGCDHDEIERFISNNCIH